MYVRGFYRKVADRFSIGLPGNKDADKLDTLSVAS